MKRIPMSTNCSQDIPQVAIRRGEEVRAEFNLRGISISAWARQHGFSAQLVYQVLDGRKRCLRGQSHQIAVKLGLKVGIVGSTNDIDAIVKNPNGASARRSTAD